MKERKSLSRNILFLVLVQFSNYIAPLLVFPYLTRVLGVEEFGIVAISFSICSIAMIFTDFGFGLSGAYWIAKNKDNIEEVNKYIGAIFVLKLIFIGVCLTVFYLYISLNYFMEGRHLLILGVIATIVFQSFQTVWLFQGIEKMKNITFVFVTSKLMYVLFVFLLVKKNNDTSFVLLALALSSFISMVLGLIRLYKEGYKISFPSKKLVLFVFNSSVHFFISRAAVGIYTSASTFIVGNFAGVQQAALYSSAEKLYQAGQSATSPLSQALFPYLARSKDQKILFKLLIFFVPIMITGVSVCIFYSSEILNLFYGAAYIQAAPVLNVFLITSIFTFLSINLGYPAFAIYERLDLANLSVYIASVLHLGCLSILFLTKAITAINIAYCVCFVEFVVLLLRFGMFFKLRAKVNGK